ncbi:MAG: glycosyltransferase family 87 protein [Chloroflexota bacterium]
MTDMRLQHKNSDTGQRSILLFKQLRENVHWILLGIGAQVVIVAYYWFEWRTFETFVLAIDHSPLFMPDFVVVYYPMGKQVFQNLTPSFGYFYTSFFALLLAPISAQTLPAAMILWEALQLISLIALCVVSARLLELPPLGTVLYVGLCTTSFPILHNLKWGQTSILITVCVIAAFLAYKRDRRILVGILLGFATAIKLYPGYFILYFILKRDVRTCVSFVLSTLIFYLVFPATIIGFDNWLAFERTTGAAIADATWISNNINSQYIVHFGLRWFDILFERTANGNVAKALEMVGYGMALSCIAVVWLLQKSAAAKRDLLSLVALFLAIPFVLKTSWPHYFVYLPFCQAAILSYLASHSRQFGLPGKGLFVFPMLSMLFSSMVVFNTFANWALYNGFGMLFLANLLLLIAVYGITVYQERNEFRATTSSKGLYA